MELFFELVAIPDQDRNDPWSRYLTLSGELKNRQKMYIMVPEKLCITYFRKKNGYLGCIFFCMYQILIFDMLDTIFYGNNVIFSGTMSFFWYHDIVFHISIYSFDTLGCIKYQPIFNREFSLFMHISWSIIITKSK